MRRRQILPLLVTLTVASAREGRAQLTSNQVYTAISPCRIVDTRFASPPTMLTPGTPRAFNVVNGTSLAAQGGSPSGCGIPGYGGSPTPSKPQVQAVMMTFIAVAPQGPGNLRAWASGPAPNSSVVNYAAVPGLNISSSAVVPLDQDGSPGADFLVQADVSATHVVIDVVGFFAERHALAGQGRPDSSVWGTNPTFFELCTGPTGASFGLSDDAVHWANSAAACPAGYWVCSAAERGLATCDTQRADSGCEGNFCDGGCTDFAPGNHRGWVANATNSGQSNGHYRFELTPGVSTTNICNQYPVWCCTY